MEVVVGVEDAVEVVGVTFGVVVVISVIIFGGVGFTVVGIIL